MVYVSQEACDRESRTATVPGRRSVCLSAVAAVERPGDAFQEAQR